MSDINSNTTSINTTPNKVNTNPTYTTPTRTTPSTCISTGTPKTTPNPNRYVVLSDKIHSNELQCEIDETTCLDEYSGYTSGSGGSGSSSCGGEVAPSTTHPVTPIANTNN